MTSTFHYRGDWSRMARVIIHQTLQTQPGERVIIHADPHYFPELLEQVRIEIVKAEAVELAAIMLHPPGLEEARTNLRRREDPTLIEMEDKAIDELFSLADIYIWLPTNLALNDGQTEKILKTWQGRSIHFHWEFNPTDPDLFQKLSAMYEQALYIDCQALDERQLRLIDALNNSTVNITNPAGTDLTFKIRDGHFHRGNGDASKEFINSYAHPGSARDREVELPTGAIRTVDISDAEGTLVCTDEVFEERKVGTLTYRFENNQIVSVQAQHHNDYVQAMWGIYIGDKGRIGEFNLGVSPALRMLPEHPKVVPYFGYGDGIVRISLGDNQESGGDVISSYHHWLFLTDATVKADDKVISEAGSLVLT